MIGRILVVEDEWIQGRELMDILGEAGLEPMGPFTNVSEALAALQNADYDAALLDIDLNGIPSFEVADTLRQEEIPFAFVTAHARASCV